MSNILVVTGSARKGRVADSVLVLVKGELENRKDTTVTVADLKGIDLPFFDSENIPASPDFAPTDVRVLAWTKLVDEADGVILLMPEYNHSMSALQKNAIDWIYTEWNDKPVSIVGYGWSGGSLALITAQAVLGNVKANLLPTSAHLRFMKQLNVDGSIIDDETIAEHITPTIDELLSVVAQPARELTSKAAN